MDAPGSFAWTWDELLELAAGALREAAAESDREQAVRGIDALDERDVHPILARAFAAAGLGVFREWPFPGPDAGLPRRSERERCDLVLTPRPTSPPRDPVADRRAWAAVEGTLFADALSPAGPTGAGPEDTVWLEVKVTGQFAFTSGVPGPSRGYGSTLVGAVKQDLAKLACEDGAGARALMLIVFAGSREVTDHDVPEALHRCLDVSLPLGLARSAGFPIADRIGNAWCAVWIVPVK